MGVFVARRLVSLVLQTLLVVCAFFLLLRLMPADPAARIAGLSGGENALLQARRALGLDASVWGQLWEYISGLFRGSLGVSWTSGTSVWQEIVERFPLTLTIVVMAFALALAVAIPLGRAAAARPGGRVDRGSGIYSLVAGAQPDFFWGLVLVYLLAVKVQVFPIPLGVLSADVAAPPEVTHFILIDALIAGNLAAFWDALWHLALPVLTLGFILIGPLLKMTRESVMNVVNADYVLYARAAGMPERHVRGLMLRNAIAPVLILTGIQFAFMLGGAVLIEYVFSLNGIGMYSLNSTLNLDYPAVQGAVLVLTVFSLLILTALDVVHAWLDPRIRLGGR